MKPNPLNAEYRNGGDMVDNRDFDNDHYERKDTLHHMEHFRRFPSALRKDLAAMGIGEDDDEVLDDQIEDNIPG